MRKPFIQNNSRNKSGSNWFLSFYKRLIQETIVKTNRCGAVPLLGTQACAEGVPSLGPRGIDNDDARAGCLLLFLP